METTSELALTLYDAFSHYRLDGPMEACPCCVSQDARIALATTPLRELSADDLNHYVFKAMTTWGTPHHFKHFLPRILDLLGSHKLLVDHELIASKLVYARWDDWPTRERAAILEYVDAIWDVANAEKDFDAIMNWTEFRNVVGEEHAYDDLKKPLHGSSM